MISNNERVGRGLDALRSGLAPYIARKLSSPLAVFLAGRANAKSEGSREQRAYR